MAVRLAFTNLIFVKCQHGYTHNKFCFAFFLQMVARFTKFKSLEKYALYGTIVPRVLTVPLEGEAHETITLQYMYQTMADIVV